MKKILIVFIFFIICIGLFFMQEVHAASIDDIFSSGDSWISEGKEHAEDGKTMNTDILEVMSGQLYNLLIAVATGVALIVGAILGIQYMTAGIDKKVQVKESLYPYLISCVVVFGSLGIWKLVVTILKGI